MLAILIHIAGAIRLDPFIVQGQSRGVEVVVLHLGFDMSPHPHALIKSIDATEAMKLPGVIAVYTGKDLARWTKGGREIVYLTPDGTMMSVEIGPAPQAIEPARPKLLFRVPLNGDVTRYRNHYAVTNDGQRFLVDIADESTREPISVVVNWDALIGP